MFLWGFVKPHALRPASRSFCLRQFHQRQRPTFRPISPSLSPLHRQPLVTRPWIKHTRAYRAINHQQLLFSWNVLRLWLQSPLVRLNVIGGTSLVLLFYLYNLEQTPLSGRWRFNVIPPKLATSMGAQYYKNDLEKNASFILEPCDLRTRMATKVLHRLTSHMEGCDMDWDMTVLDKPSRFAGVYPGGKILITTGMIDFCQTEDELAIILGHEVCHALAHHGAESLTRWVISTPMTLVAFLVTGLSADGWEMATDIFFTLPRSRLQEIEADRYGVSLAARCGYDVSRALDLWDRWHTLEKDDEGFASYLSTHPGHFERLRLMYQLIYQTWRLPLTKDYLANHSVDAYYVQREICAGQRDSEHYLTSLQSGNE